MVNMAWYDTAQITKLENAIKEKDWFTAIVLSATQLERHGFLLIKEYFESLKVDSNLVKKLLHRKHLYDINGYLRIIGKIDIEEYQTIERINEERNNFLHRRETEEFLRGKQAEEVYEVLTSKAIRILKEKLNAVRLFVSY